MALFLAYSPRTRKEYLVIADGARPETRRARATDLLRYAGGSVTSADPVEQEASRDFLLEELANQDQWVELFRHKLAPSEGIYERCKS